MLQQQLQSKCVYNKNLKWPILFQQFIDDGFNERNEMLHIGQSKLTV